jgi:hypothetical protein
MGDAEDTDHAEPAEEQQEQQQQPAAAAAVSSNKQQQREAARQETLQKKVDSGQKVLTFMAYDKAVLAQLPEFVQQQVPFLTTAKGAIDLQLLEFAKALAVSNVSFSNIANRLEELTNTQYYSRQLLYYSYAKEADAAAAAGRGENSCEGCWLMRCWYALLHYTLNNSSQAAQAYVCCRRTHNHTCCCSSWFSTTGPNHSRSCSSSP